MCCPSTGRPCVASQRYAGHSAREAIPSVYRPGLPGGDESRVVAHLARFFEREGFDVQQKEAAPGRPNLWAFLAGDRPGRMLLFEGHTDVVTKGDADAWRHPPFAATLEGGGSTGGVPATPRATPPLRSSP